MKRLAGMLFLLIIMGTFHLSAQSDKSEKKRSVYRDEVLVLVKDKEFEGALLLIEEALLLYPDDRELLGLLKSIQDLKKLNDPVFGDDPPAVTDEPSYDKMEKPDFSITTRDPDKTGSGEKARNTVSIDIAVKSMTSLGPLDDPLTFLAPGTTALGTSGDLRYNFPFFRKLIGFGIWYEGYFSGFTGSELSEILFHQGGANLLLRSFPNESNEARTEVALELGGGIAFFRNDLSGDDSIYYRLLMQLALYIEDPLLYRLFSYDNLKPLLVKGGIRFFYYFVEDTNMVRYRLGMALRPLGKWWDAGIYLHLEDMDISDWSISSWGIILGFGFRF
jgi:hypothetical protein